MTDDDTWPMIYRPATLVFKTVHYDKAGETSSFCVVDAEVADCDASANVLLVTRHGVHVRFLAHKLYPVQDAATLPEFQSYIGGHELTRDFHPARGAPRTTVRWLERSEVEQLLAERDQS